MGYTHYLRRVPELDAFSFASWARDVRRIVDAVQGTIVPTTSERDFDGRPHAGTPAPLRICGPDGTGEPEITPNVVALNGDAAAQLDYETFLVERVYDSAFWSVDEHGMLFTCCKTAYRPYDLVVTPSLVRMAYCFSAREALMTSDGDAADWYAGAALCRACFGIGAVPIGTLRHT